jgi:alcohol dehydrogenase (cytochrome c)
MIVTTPHDRIYALDAVNGTKFWEYDYPLDRRALRIVCCDMVNRGVALYGNYAYMGTLDAHVLAIDARNGRVVWNHAIYPDAPAGYSITGAPLVVDGLLITGEGGGEYGARGFLVALNPLTGAEVWKQYTVPSPSEPGGNTWPGNTYLHGGATPWLTGSYDAQTDTLLWGTSNPGPWYSALRKGRNLYSDSVLGLDPHTGRIKWFFQQTPNDSWDYDGVNTPVEADVSVGGVRRKVFYQSARNGWFYVVDRTNGKALLAQPFTKVTSVTGYDFKRQISLIDTKMIPGIGQKVFTCPGWVGGTDWWLPSFDPQTGYAYVPTERTCMTVAALPPRPFQAGTEYLGESYQFEHVPGRSGWGALQAIDVSTGRTVWSHETKLPWTDGTLTTDGGLVFSGTPDRHFYAFDARTGKVLWSYTTRSGITGQPMSYVVDGKQYVAVQSGYGGVAPTLLGPKIAPLFRHIPLGGQLYVFSL